MTLDTYDAGLLPGEGMPNCEWWWDVIRAKFGEAHDFYELQCRHFNGERQRLECENARLKAEMGWRAEPWGDVQIKNMDASTPEQLREAAERLIDDGEHLGAPPSPYGKHTGCALQFDEVHVGLAYLRLEQRVKELEAALAVALPYVEAAHAVAHLHDGGEPRHFAIDDTLALVRAALKGELKEEPCP